jgi:hypothetical protein
MYCAPMRRHLIVAQRLRGRKNIFKHCHLLRGTRIPGWFGSSLRLLVPMVCMGEFLLVCGSPLNAQPPSSLKVREPGATRRG